MDFATIALYRGFGFNLVPLGNDKRPVVVGAYPDGKPKRFHWRDWEIIPQSDNYWEKLPYQSWWGDVQGLAAVCGPVSGHLVCVDFDGVSDEQPVLTMLSRLHLPLDYPWWWPTPGGGFHLWLRCLDLALPGDKGKVDRQGRDAGHIEIRYTGHYVALPPSVHPSGGVYGWLHGEPDVMPATVAQDALRAAYDAVTVEVESVSAPASRATLNGAHGAGAEVTEEYVKAALADELDGLARAVSGKRNDSLNTRSFVLGQLVADGLLSRSEVEEKLTAVALSIGLGESEILATIASGLNSGLKEPRGLRLKANRNGHGPGAEDVVNVDSNGQPAPVWLEARDEITGSVTFHPYAVLNGRIVHYQLRKSGDVDDTPVADFTAAITTEITTEDGQKVFVVEGEGKRAGPYSVEIAAETIGEDRRLRAVLEGAVGALDSVYARMGGHLGPAIKHLTNEENLRRLRRYQRTGWNDNDFLFPGLNGNDIQITLPDKLPYGCSADADSEQGLRALEAWLDSNDPEKTTVLLAHALTGPLAKPANWRNERYGVFVKGLTGTFKTSTVQTLLCLYGPKFSRDEALIKWGEGATRNGIIQLAANAHDMPFLIDNYKPNTGGGSNDFVALIHNIMEGSEKIRLNRAAQLRESKPLLCWPVMTGEDMPDTDAASLARVLTIVFERDGLRNNDKLSIAQALSGHLPAIGKAWIEWLMREQGQTAARETGARLPDVRTVWATFLHEQRTDMVNPLRVATNLALNELAFAVACQHPLFGNLLSEYQRIHIAGLEAIAAEMAQSTVESLEALRFLSILRELLATGRALLVPRHKGTPNERDVDRFIGWSETDGSAYLMIKMALHLVRKYSQENFYSTDQLYKQLASLGLLASTDKKRHTKDIRVLGEKKTTLHLTASAISNDG